MHAGCPGADPSFPGAARVAGGAEQGAVPERQVGCGRCGAHAWLPGRDSGSLYARSLRPWGLPSRHTHTPDPSDPSSLLWPLLRTASTLLLSRLCSYKWSGLVGASQGSGAGAYPDSGAVAAWSFVRTPKTGVLGSESSTAIPSRVPQVISVFLHPTWWPGSHGALGESSLNVGRRTQQPLTLRLRRLQTEGYLYPLRGSLALVPPTPTASWR